MPSASIVWISRNAVARGNPAARASAETLLPSECAAVCRSSVIAFWIDWFSVGASRLSATVALGPPASTGFRVESTTTWP
jgi:hypothetical protein